MSVSNTVKTIQDIMRKDSGVDGDAQRIGQLTWMLFLKILDDSEREAELMDKNFKSPMPQKYRWRNWAADAEGITGEPLANFINNELFPKLKDLPVNGNKRAIVIREAFADAFNYMKSGQLIRQVINKIQEGIDFNKTEDRHLFGDIYEQILRDLQTAGNAGEFYTPRAVTQFMVDMVDPQLGESMLDPACGTGGFLTCTIEHVRGKYVKTAKDEQRLQDSIHGVEKKQLPHLLCTTNMLLHGMSVPSFIEHKNMLERPLRDYGASDRVDVIITNPPFGGIEEDGVENGFPTKFRTKETADLFLVLILTLLKDGGRGAIVLPDGFLFGEGIKSRIKEEFLEKCNLHTIVRLPNGVFAPYTGIKTNLLFFTKGEPTKDIWYYAHPYPDGVKTYNKTKPIRIEEFDAEKKWWPQKKRKESELCWKVPFKQLKDEAKAKAEKHWNAAEKLNAQAAKLNGKSDEAEKLREQAAQEQRAGDNAYWPIFNLDSKNPNEAQVVHTDPDELLDDYRKVLAEVSETRAALKAELQTALTRQIGVKA